MCAAGFRPHVASASLVAAIKCQQLGEGPIQQLTVSAPALKALSGLTTLRALTLNVDKARQRSGGGVRCVVWVGVEGGDCICGCEGVCGWLFCGGGATVMQTAC